MWRRRYGGVWRGRDRTGSGGSAAYTAVRSRDCVTYDFDGTVKLNVRQRSATYVYDETLNKDNGVYYVTT